MILKIWKRYRINGINILFIEATHTRVSEYSVIVDGVLQHQGNDITEARNALWKLHRKEGDKEKAKINKRRRERRRRDNKLVMMETGDDI